ncbi:MAG: PstS family phosphate ABC transporter substrate-binding protein [Candidatus Kryptoniota bacterium]
MMIRNKVLLLLALAFVVLIGSCKSRKPEPSPTEGTATIYCAESVEPVVKQIAQQYMELYTKAHLTIVPVTTREAIAKLLNNETKVIVASRPFNAEELGVMKKYNISVDSFKVAYDGIAVIVNGINPIQKLTVQQLKDIYAGKTTEWAQIGDKFYGRIIPALESVNSGTVEFFNDRVMAGTKFGEVYPCTTMSRVYDFVKKNDHAIGFVSANWIFASLGNEGKQGKEPKAIALAETDSACMKYIDPNSFGSYYLPYQAHIYRRYYPLTRAIYMYSRDFDYGLGAGFTTFTASAAGQKIFLNSGLVPATMPVRLVQLNDQPL